MITAGTYGWWLVMAPDPENGPAYTPDEWAAQVADTDWTITGGRWTYRGGNDQIGGVFYVRPVVR
jgi:hypothetical protein